MTSYNLDPADADYSCESFYIAECPRCEGVHLIEHGYNLVGGEFVSNEHYDVLYPQSKTVNLNGVPETVARAFLNASRSFEASLYEPCAIMCRKSVEAVCHELGAQRGNLNSRLRELRERQLIDQRLIEWADELRLLGNDAAHDLTVTIEKVDAADALGFVEALVTYAFELNARFDEFRSRQKERRQRPKSVAERKEVEEPE
ncbi:MAG: DUF4145 domain-containing protein [bacterium]|nr:DUF4145 domain-containing protein [bacterium]